MINQYINYSGLGRWYLGEILHNLFANNVRKKMSAPRRPAPPPPSRPGTRRYSVDVSSDYPAYYSHFFSRSSTSCSGLVQIRSPKGMNEKNEKCEICQTGNGPWGVHLQLLFLFVLNLCYSRIQNVLHYKS